MPIPFESLRAAYASHVFQASLTLLILAFAFHGFVRERRPPDLTALLALLALLLTGILRPEEAFAGFAHPATISVAAMLVLSAGIERTGALSYVARRFFVPIGHSEFLFTLVLMVVGAVVSAFTSNTAQVAVSIPIVLEVCRRTGASPGRVLMPMSHAITFGGMCVLIGTSTNIAVHEFARAHGLPGYSMWELAKVGIPMAIVGSVYILAIGRWFLPRNTVQDVMAIPPERAGHYVSELVVLPGSRWIGRDLRPDHFRRDFDLELVSLVRDGVDLSDRLPAVQLAAGDRLRVRGALDRVLSLAAREGLELHRPDAAGTSSAEVAPREAGSSAGSAGPESAPAATAVPRLPLCEIIVLPRAPLIGLTLKASRFAERYGAVVLGLHRPGEAVTEHPATIPIHAGDVLVLEGEPAALQALSETRGFLVIGTPAHPEERPEKLWIAVLTMVGVVVAITFNWLPIVTAATAGCVMLMLTGCLRPREAYQAIDWSIIFLLAGALAIGTAIQKTGLSDDLGHWLSSLTGFTGPRAVLAGFYLSAMVLSEFMSNSATALLLAPVAFASAQQMGVNPMPLLVAVTFGASAAFAMPIGYQTSLMIYGPGGYRFRDFLRMGLVLDLLLTAIALWLIPHFWPLAPP